MPVDEGYGFLFPKKDRQGSQPNLTGKAKLNGREFEIAGWTKTAKSGVKYLSLKVQDAGGEADPNQEAIPVEGAATTTAPAEDEDTPF